VYEDMEFLVSRCESRMRRYIAHVVRGQVEDTAKVSRRQNLGPNQAEVTIDYKQKWLECLLRESQVRYLQTDRRIILL
jgi:hypothetical protein